jgi:AcrR family transcriptional regulator
LRRDCHHGSLTQALLEAVLALIRAKVPGGFTFAEAARAAGVSPAAPYRHYRDALMTEVAQQGFLFLLRCPHSPTRAARPAGPHCRRDGTGYDAVGCLADLASGADP